MYKKHPDGHISISAPAALCRHSLHNPLGVPCAIGHLYDEIIPHTRKCYEYLTPVGLVEMVYGIDNAKCIAIQDANDFEPDAAKRLAVFAAQMTELGIELIEEPADASHD